MWCSWHCRVSQEQPERVPEAFPSPNASLKEKGGATILFIWLIICSGCTSTRSIVLHFEMRMWHGLDFRSKIRGGIFALLQHRWDSSHKLHWERNDVNVGMLLWNPETELCLVKISIAFSLLQLFHFGEELAPSRPRDQSCWKMERPVMLGVGEQCLLSFAIFNVPYTGVLLKSEITQSLVH